MSNDNKITIKDFNNNNIPDEEEMETCCSGTSDRRFGTFLIQLFITFSIISLSVYKLSLNDLSCEQSQLYSNLLFTIVGYWCRELKDNKR